MYILTLIKQEDWNKWFYRFIEYLFNNSPIIPLQLCKSFATEDLEITKKFFNILFTSVWRDLNTIKQDSLIKILDNLLNVEVVPENITKSLLELVDYMERMELVKN